MSTLTTLNKPMHICVNRIGIVLSWLWLHKEHEERVTMNVTKHNMHVYSCYSQELLIVHVFDLCLGSLAITYSPLITWIHERYIVVNTWIPCQVSCVLLHKYNTAPNHSFPMHSKIKVRAFILCMFKPSATKLWYLWVLPTTSWLLQNDRVIKNLWTVCNHAFWCDQT